MELELKNAKQNFEFATNDERKILFTVSIRLTEGYIQRAKAILEQTLTKDS